MRRILIASLFMAACGTMQAPGERIEKAEREQKAAPASKAPLRNELHLLFTSDEHGWMFPLKDDAAGVERGGVVAVFDRLTRIEGYSPTPAARDAGYVLLSSGDMWTGPYESTVLEGAPMVAAMSHMNYAAAAIGNHEFDFGVRVLAERSKSARFAFLAANLIEAGTGAQPAWAKPFTIIDAGGLKLGIVGLTNVDSPVTSDPRHMTGLRFLPYVDAIEQWAPRARAAGADEIVVLIHEEMAVAPSLMAALRKHRVRAVAFGHHHHADSRIDDNNTADPDDDIALCNAGPYLRSYCRIDLMFVDRKLTGREVRVSTVETAIGSSPPSQDPELVAIVKNAENSANQIGGEVLVENMRVMKRGADGAIGQFVVDAWLKALPYAQVAITNAGGLRQDLSAGPVRTRDVVSVLPFNNYLLVVDLTGAQLREILANDESIVGGVRFSYKVKQKVREIVSLTTHDGKPIEDGDKLKVVINDFMYRGGDRYQFQSFDAEPEETAIDWREPVLRALREMGKQSKKLEVAPDDRAKKL